MAARSARIALWLSAAALTWALPPPLFGNASAVYALLERLLPGASPFFALSLGPSCPSNAACFVLSDAPPATPGGAGTVAIAGTRANDLSAGLGFYLREYANITVGWPRGGGSRVVPPPTWPAVGSRVVRSRVGPFSFAMNVCTHSYTLVWYNWQQWSAFIDWLALSGINLVYALTGQEEVQWRVFTGLGVSDDDVRSWFNGPAFLTWSRGQNVHGSSIGGPLPRSWMQAQFKLQLQILERERELGIVGALPAFQGNVPWPLVAALGGDANVTEMVGDYGPVPTGWMDALDPSGNFGRVADAWMDALCAAFSCPDHFYQMDGFFSDGSDWGSPWSGGLHVPRRGSVNCTWTAPLTQQYLPGCAAAAAGAKCPAFTSLAAALGACVASADCIGVTEHIPNSFELRAGVDPEPSKTNETSWKIANLAECKAGPRPAPDWLGRGRAAYAALLRADPDAAWAFQGWALNVIDRSDGHDTAETAARLRGFADAAAPNFLTFDMALTGSPPQWEVYAIGDIPFVHTALYTFGGNDGLKGNMTRLNAALPWVSVNESGFVGVGFTPEGFDQNPPLFELIAQSSFASGPQPDVAAWLVRRAHVRYGLVEENVDVTAAWRALASSVYAADQPSHDTTGVARMSAQLNPLFWTTSGPTSRLCSVREAALALLRGASAVSGPPWPEPFSYDVVNTAREVLAQLSTPLAVNFSAAISGPDGIDALAANQTGLAYAGLLEDLDALLATDTASLLGPWIADARQWGGNASDCGASFRGDISCADFYEWNARAQLTTWYPPTSRAYNVSAPNINNYASKQWQGLVGSFYASRVRTVLAVALASAPGPLNASRENSEIAAMQWDWVTGTQPFPTEPQGDPVEVAAAVLAKYAVAFDSCL